MSTIDDLLRDREKVYPCKYCPKNEINKYNRIKYEFFGRAIEEPTPNSNALAKHHQSIRQPMNGLGGGCRPFLFAFILFIVAV